MKLKALKWFIICYLIFFVVAIVLLFNIEKGDWVIYLNQNRTLFLDYFFKYWTHLGDGVFAILLILTMLLVKYRYAVMLAVTVIAQGLVSLFLKKVVFSNSLRPRNYLADIYDLNFIEGVKVHGYNSFPSGHTMTAFSIAAFLTLIAKDKRFGILFFIYALLVGFSRNYLSQHFFEDIVAGSLVGIILTIVIWKAFAKKVEQNWLGGKLFE